MCDVCRRLGANNSGSGQVSEFSSRPSRQLLRAAMQRIEPCTFQLAPGLSFRGAQPHPQHDSHRPSLSSDTTERPVRRAGDRVRHRRPHDCGTAVRTRLARGRARAALHRGRRHAQLRPRGLRVGRRRPLHRRHGQADDRAPDDGFPDAGKPRLGADGRALRPVLHRRPRLRRRRGPRGVPGQPRGLLPARSSRDRPLPRAAQRSLARHAHVLGGPHVAAVGRGRRGPDPALAAAAQLPDEPRGKSCRKSRRTRS